MAIVESLDYATFVWISASETGQKPEGKEVRNGSPRNADGLNPGPRRRVTSTQTLLHQMALLQGRQARISTFRFSMNSIPPRNHPGKTGCDIRNVSRQILGGRLVAFLNAIRNRFSLL